MSIQKKPNSRLFGQLSKSRDDFASRLSVLFEQGIIINDALYDEVEDQLIMGDMGVESAQKIIRQLREKTRTTKLDSTEDFLKLLKTQIGQLLHSVEQSMDISEHKPYVILMVGVNGVGKTTTAAKLANRFLNQGKTVMLAAGDTFRAAAIEQLQKWGDHLDIPVIAQKHGADAAAVAYDAYHAAKNRDIDVLIIDTAGRQHTHGDLMDQLAKMARVLKKADPTLPHEVMLTVDAGTGQNALSQIEHFKEVIGVTSLSVSKLDGTAKGGIIIAIAEKYGLPIRFIGIGEAMQDLRPFSAQSFAQALLPESLGDSHAAQ